MQIEIEFNVERRQYIASHNDNGALLGSGETPNLALIQVLAAVSRAFRDRNDMKARAVVDKAIEAIFSL